MVLCQTVVEIAELVRGGRNLHDSQEARLAVLLPDSLCWEPLLCVCLTVSGRIAVERSLAEWPVASRLTDSIFFGAAKPCCQGCACHSVRVLSSLLLKQLTRVQDSHWKGCVCHWRECSGAFNS